MICSKHNNEETNNQLNLYRVCQCGAAGVEKVVLWLEHFGWSSRVRVTGDNGASVVVVVVDQVGLVE